MFTLLNTDRLKIHNLQESDFDHLHAYRNDEKVAEHQGWTDKTETQIRTLLTVQKSLSPGKLGEWFMFAIEAKETGQLIGDCALCINTDDPRQAELGITLSSPAQGKGYASEAITAILDFIFHKLNVQRVVMITNTANISCLKLITSLKIKSVDLSKGFSAEKLDKEFYGVKDTETICAVLKEEWRALQEVKLKTKPVTTGTAVDYSSLN